ncbi:pimeloyl-ACP methyl ester carboxylesterase [Hamadaea flava]|uniref:Alpha/beta fold hydrolase n=1 Tax=Hamadaea flava TaxID=1742688 RepID=A0ABV8LXL5_9ACTN|nr:alpha/beta hydrolase [Hamadaea flava]MCP2324541.1 pimeloyl-ACP methyl ester carboxylesterase [Hamadaea flava]
MKLHVHEAGDGDKVAVLLHGAMADHGTWQAVEAELIRRGYRVIAPDLRGHGLSPRGDYAPKSYADDLVENLPTGADIAIGHSLGGLALALAVDRLRPARAVYSDPAFVLPFTPPELRTTLATFADQATAHSVRAMNPRWSDADVAAEIAGFGRFDREIGTALADLSGRDFTPESAVVPSLVQAAGAGDLIDDGLARRLRDRGFEVRVVAGAGHCIHREDPAGFFASLTGWV